MKIKEYRKTAGLTQEQLSKLFNPPIPLDTIKKWDSGQRNPPDWVEGLIIRNLKMYQRGIVSTILTQEEVSKIMIALTIAKMEAQKNINFSRNQEEKALREFTAKEWEDMQWEIGLKLGYYTESEEYSQKENTEDLMVGGQ